MNTPQASPELIGKYTSIADLRSKAMVWVKTNLVGREIKNSSFSTSKKITLTWQGLKNDINEPGQFLIEKLLSFTCLPEIIKEAKYIGVQADKRNRKNMIIHKFISSVKVKNTVFDVWFVVFETEKTYVYDHGLLLK